MKNLKVGSELYPKPLPDGLYVDGTSLWLIVLSIADPDPIAHVAAVQLGEIRVAVDRLEPGALTFMVQLGGEPWSAAAWVPSARTAPEQRSGLPAGAGGLLGLVCTDRAGVIRATRLFGLTTNVAAALRSLESDARSAETPASLPSAVKWTQTTAPETIGMAARLAPVVTSVPRKAPYGTA